jgi:hypothetical protein
MNYSGKRSEAARLPLPLARPLQMSGLDTVDRHGIRVGTSLETEKNLQRLERF